MIKQGIATYLHTNPMLRGNVSKVTPEGFWVTWHPYITDVPEALSKDSKVNVRLGSVRMRVFYPNREARNVGFGVPTDDD